MIKIYHFDTAEEAGKFGAGVIAEVIRKKPDAVIGLATGSSPIGMYKELIRKNKAGEISFKKVRTVNLDEYVGLSADHDQSYVYFMRKNLFDHIDIPVENTNLPNGLCEDAEAECKRYDGVIRSMGGIDVQVLGIGNNGHIGFNEPSDSFSYGTSLINLTDSTIDANSRFFASRDLVPKQALSMGVGQIMSAEKIVMVAMGKGKAKILEEALFGEITPKNQASILRFFKGDVIVCADSEALSVIVEKHPEAVIK